MPPETINKMGSTEIITTPVIDTSEISRYEQARLNWRCLKRAMIKHNKAVMIRAFKGWVRALLGVSLKA